MDEELRGLAFTTLQALMLDFPEWREDVLSGFVYFIVREVTDIHPTLLDNAIKMLLQLISQWRQAVQTSNKVGGEWIAMASLFVLLYFGLLCVFLTLYKERVWNSLLCTVVVVLLCILTWVCVRK